MIKVNDIVRIERWKQGLRVKAVSEDGKWVIASKKAFGSSLYTIINTEEKIAGTDNWILGRFDYNNIEECQEVLKELIKGKTEISRRRQVKYKTLFVNGKEVE